MNLQIVNELPANLIHKKQHKVPKTLAIQLAILEGVTIRYYEGKYLIQETEGLYTIYKFQENNYDYYDYTLDCTKRYGEHIMHAVGDIKILKVEKVKLTQETLKKNKDLPNPERNRKNAAEICQSEQQNIPLLFQNLLKEF